MRDSVAGPVLPQPTSDVQYPSSPRLESALPGVEINPRDAREHVDCGTLALWAQQEVESLHRCVLSSHQTDSSADRMLQLLTFAYACHVLASDQVLMACQTNPAFQFLCHGSPPFPSEIIAFRRRFRRQLELALARTLTKVLTHDLDGTAGGAFPSLLEAARQRLDVARHLDMWG